MGLAGLALGADRRQRLEALTFWSRANTLVMGLLRIAVALYSAVWEAPEHSGPGCGPKMRPHQTPPPPLRQPASLIGRLELISKASGRCRTSC